MRRFHFPAILSVISIISLPGMASAMPVESMYPQADKNSNPACYMESSSGSTLDLSKICGFGGNSSASSISGSTFNTSGTIRSSSSGSFSSGSSSRCMYPDDRAADGSRCGARAASVRPGGNTDSSNFTPNYGEGASETIARQKREVEAAFSRKLF